MTDSSGIITYNITKDNHIKRTKEKGAAIIIAFIAYGRLSLFGKDLRKDVNELNDSVKVSLCLI